MRWAPMSVGLLVSACLAAIGVQTAAAETATRTVSADSLCICGVRAQVSVSPGGDDGGMTVRMSGPAEALDSIETSVSEGELRLSGGGEGNRVTTTVRNGGSTTTVVSGSGPIRVEGDFPNGVSVTSRGEGRSATVEITVTAPPGTPLRVAPLLGDLDVGALDGPLTATIETGSLSVESAGPASIDLVGAGSVAIGSVSGHLAVRLSGNGGVSVTDGAVDALKVALSGAGDVSFGGRAKTADLALSGTGMIRVDHVVERPRIRVTGAGAVDVGNW